MSTPLETFITWFDAAPGEIQEQVAFTGTCLVPRLFPREAELDAKGMIAAFRARLVASSTLEDVGTTLVVAALSDFVMLKSTKESFDSVRTLWESILCDPTQREGFRDLARSSLERLPFRSRLWEREAERWHNLRAESLSNVAIDAWLKIKMSDRASP